MSAEHRSDYLATRVRTASPAHLHLMLVEGALRLLAQADQALLRSDETSANAAIMRALEIVEELLAGVRHSDDEINVKLAQLYHFVYVQVTRAYVNSDREMIAEAVRILDFQRETWRQACELVGGAASQEGASPAPIAPPHGAAAPADAGLSLEA